MLTGLFKVFWEHPLFGQLDDVGNRLHDSVGNKLAVNYQVDIDLLQQVIEGPEEWLEARGKILKPESKAKVIRLLYEYFNDTKRSVDKKTVNNYLRLVS